MVKAKKIGKKYIFVSKNYHPKTLIPPPKHAHLYVKKIREIFIFKEKWKSSFNQASTKVQSKLLLHSVAQKLWPLQPFNNRCVWGKYLQKMREINSQIFIPNMPVIKWL